MSSKNQWFCAGIAALYIGSTLSVFGQIDPGDRPVRVLQFVDEVDSRLGIVIVAEESGRGYETDHEYWRFDESALADIGGRDTVEINVWAEGSWDDPEVVEALSWYPASRGVEWIHPTKVEWTPLENEDPPATGEGIYFGNTDVGGLTVDYSPEGDASLTWFKLTEGDFMQLEDGTVFQRGDQPSTGAWWSGAID